MKNFAFAFGFGLTLVACGSQDASSSSASASGANASAASAPSATATPSHEHKHARGENSAAPDEPSASCSKDSAPCDGEAKLDIAGKERTFRFHLPKADKPGVVVALHGDGGDGANMQHATQFDRVGDADGFIAIYPDGIDKSWNNVSRKTGAGADGVDDVAFVGALIDYATNTFGADSARVIVAGFSNGAVMVHRVGCELAGKVSAIAAAEGLMPVDEATSCTPARPISVILFNGDADTHMPFKGRPANKKDGEFMSASDTAAKWAALEHCAPNPTSTDEPDVDPAHKTHSKRATYAGCNGGVNVVFFTIAGGEHAWDEHEQPAETKKQEKKDEKKEEKAEEKGTRPGHDLDESELIWKLGVHA